MLMWILIAVVALLGYVALVYNQLVSLREVVRNEAKQIDVQLDRRYKVYESLISAVSKFLDYEKTVLKDVVALRAQARTAEQKGDTSNQMAAENAISEAASGLHVMVESYPDLKGNETVLNLMEEISTTENKLSFAKQSYNDSAEKYNATLQKFPINLLVSWLSFEAFSYWQLAADDAKSKDEYVAKL